MFRLGILMKVYPIKYNISSPNLYLYSNSNSNVSLPIYSSGKDRFELSFTAFEDSRKVNLEDGLNISGIHCPSCGVKMISPKDYEILIERAGMVKNAEEFVELLKEHKKYIPSYMRDILKDADNPENYKGLSVFDFHKKQGFQAYCKKRKRIRQARNLLNEYADNFPPEKQAIIKNTVQNIHSYENYKTYKTHIVNLCKELNLDKQEQAYFRNKFLRDVATSELYYNAFYLGRPENLGVSSFSELPSDYIAKSLIKNIFSNVTSNLNYVDKHRSYLNNPNNSILLCHSCEENNKNKVMFWKSGDSPYTKDNIKRYLGDIAKLMGQGNIERSDGYIRYVCYVSDIGSNHKIHFENQEIMSLRSVMHLSDRHEGFVPIEQTKVDIPCACCGSTMLPHAVRIEIEEDMRKCNTPKDYAQVIKKYEKYIGKYAQEPARLFLEIVEMNPNISKTEFLDKYKRKMEKYSSVGTRLAINKYIDKRSYYAMNASKEILDFFDIAAKRISEYVASGKFKDYDYTKMYDGCLGDADVSSYGQKALYILCTDLKEVAHKHGVIKEIETDNLDKDEIYSIVFKLFKFDVATADHLVAVAKGGGKTPDNLIGLCKGCNTIVKSSKSVNSWYSQNYGVRFNLKKQLHIIDQMAKDGQLQGYDNWAKNIANSMYELTYGKYDIRPEFE